MAEDFPELEEPWGQLVAVEESGDGDRFPFTDSEVTIGRSTGCDVSFPGCKYLSNVHCRLLKDQLGRVFLRDTSTNGTLVSSQRVKKEQIEIENGTVLKLVYNKASPQSNIIFKFFDLRPKEDRPVIYKDSLVESDSTTTTTVEPQSDSAPLHDSPPAQLTTPTPSTGAVQSRPQPSPPPHTTPTNCTSGESPPSAPGGGMLLSGLERSGQSAAVSSEVSAQPTSSSVDGSSGVVPTASVAHTRKRSHYRVTESGKPSANSDKVKDSSPAKKKKEKEGSGEDDDSGSELEGEEKEQGGGMTKRKKEEKGTELEGLDVKAAVTETGTGSSREAVCNGPTAGRGDSIGDNLVCGICQEIFHHCISLQPCMHSYCGGCYSEWMERSNKCPECRSKVDRLSLNYIVNNLVQSYFNLHPEKKRTEEDLKELDEKNKITKDMLYPKPKRNRYIHLSDEEGSSDTLDSNSGSEDGSRTVHVHFGGRWAPTLIPAPATVCRQCPGGVPTGAPSSALTPPPYACPVMGAHLTCQCCRSFMPARSATDPSIPPQHCSVCGQHYCHMYWGCAALHCRGCLGKYKDMSLDPEVLNDIISGNHFESSVVKDYLTQQGKGVDNLLSECLDRASSGTYPFKDDFGRPLGQDTVVCAKCAAKQLKKLAYQYREGIPSEDLPNSVTGRANCHYGRHCRTQTHNQDHARRFNHICEQTRF